jgi:hypothetical protein
MMEVKGHASGVNTWSEVVAFKLRSLCPKRCPLEKEDDDIVLWVALFPL